MLGEASRLDDLSIMFGYEVAAGQRAGSSQQLEGRVQAPSVKRRLGSVR